MPARLDSHFVAVVLLGMLISSTASAGELCQFPDLAGVEPVQMMPGAVGPSGNGGDIPGGRWELVALRYSTNPPSDNLQGEAIGVIEMAADDAQSGFARLALDVTITSPVDESIEEEGAGPYTVFGSELRFVNDCGEGTLLDAVEYRIDNSGELPRMTLWGSTSFTVSIPFPIVVTVNLQAEFELVAPQTVEDPIFDDRFQEIKSP